MTEDEFAQQAADALVEIIWISKYEAARAHIDVAAALRAAAEQAREETLEAIAIQFETNGFVDACASDGAIGRLSESEWRRAATSIRSLKSPAKETTND